MIQKVSKNIVDWQISKRILTDEQRALYQYAYEILFSYIINITIMILLAVVMHSVVSVFVFFACYILLRTYCGGYHAKTNLVCSIVSAILILILCFAQKAINGSLSSLYPMCYVLSGILIFSLAPVADKNKPLDEIETIRYRKRSRYIWAIEAILGMILWYIKSSLSVTMALTHCIFSVTLVYGKIKNSLED